MKTNQDISLGSLEQYMREVQRIPTLTPGEETDLLLRLKNGIDAGQARERIVAGYQPLLIGLAKRFARHCRELELLDLVQEGNEGLLRALEKYDMGKGESTFRTFAFSWIRTVMLTAFWQYEKAIRLPLHKVRAIRQMGTVTTRLLSELGREPSVAETAREMSIQERDVRELVMLQDQQVVSLHAFPRDDDELALEETIADPTTTNSADDIGMSVEEALLHLSERERVVVKLRFGFHDGQTYTQKEVANVLGVALSTVIALDRRAQKRLRQVLSA